MKTISKKMLFINIFILIAVILVLVAPFIKSGKVHADTQNYYYYIKQNTVLIPDGQTIKGNIQLTATYYVQATGNPDVTINEISYRKVIYNGVSGLVPTASLSKKSINNVNTPFFNSAGKLTATADGDDELLMFFNIVDSQINCLKLPNNTNLEFIAYSDNGKYILAKLTDSTIGFVAKKNCSPQVILSPHPNPVDPDKETEDTTLTPNNPSADTKVTTKNNIVRVILIVTLCIIVVIVVFLIFKPSKKAAAAKDDFYDL